MQHDWSCINVFVAAVKHVCLQRVMYYRYIYYGNPRQEKENQKDSTFDTLPNE
jgi:hypothetical protein